MPINNQELSAILAKYNNATTIGTALRRAAAGQGKKEELEKDIKILAAAADVINEKDNNPQFGRTALHQAVVNGNKLAVEILLQLGARYDIEDAKSATVLCLSNIDSEIKKLLLMKIATDKSNDVFKNYTAVETYQERKIDEPLLDQLSSWMSDKLSNGNTLASFIQMALMFQATADHQGETQTAEKFNLQNQAYSQLISLYKIYIQADVFKSAIKIYPVKMNFCGVLCCHLGSELLKHKAFANGVVPFTLVKIYVTAGDHEFILINGSIDNIRPDTILCNIFRNEVFCGVQVQQYLKAHPATQTSCEFTNTHPNFDNFIYGKRELYNFISQIKNISLADNNKSSEQVPVLSFLIKTAYDLMVQKPNIAEKAFELIRKQGGDSSVSLIKALMRDYKSASFGNTAALTSFPPLSVAKSTSKNMVSTALESRAQRKP